MIGILIATLVLGGIWWVRQRRSHRVRRFRQPTLVSASKAAPRYLISRLDRLTRDRRVSERLIERVEFNHPGKSRRWCIEKAIYDIERDRRS